MLFCKKCKNMLYVRHNNEDNDRLYYDCKHCASVFSADELEGGSSLISSFNYEDDQSSFKQFLNPNIKYDNTLPHIDYIKCPNIKCTKNPTATNDVIFIKYDIVSLKFVYYCTYCECFWKNNTNTIMQSH